jgi:hypothetical protein
VFAELEADITKCNFSFGCKLGPASIRMDTPVSVRFCVLRRPPNTSALSVCICKPSDKRGISGCFTRRRSCDGRWVIGARQGGHAMGLTARRGLKKLIRLHGNRSAMPRGPWWNMWSWQDVVSPMIRSVRRPTYLVIVLPSIQDPPHRHNRTRLQHPDRTRGIGDVALNRCGSFTV